MDIEELFQQLAYEEQLAKEYGLDLENINLDKIDKEKKNTDEKD